MYVARWLLHRIAEDFDVIISFDAKPEKGDWNGAGAHTNFSTNGMRDGYESVEKAVKALGAKWELHVKNYGARDRGAPHGQARDRAVEQVQLRRVRPGRLGAHPLAGGQGRPGLHRGPAAERQHGSVRGHPADHRHDLLGARLSDLVSGGGGSSLRATRPAELLPESTPARQDWAG